MTISKKVSLLTAEDLGLLVGASGVVRERIMNPYSDFPYRYSGKVRVEGELEGFEPEVHDPRKRVRTVTPETAQFPEPGYIVHLGGVTVLVPKNNVVTLKAS